MSSIIQRARRLGCKPEAHTLFVKVFELHDLPEQFDEASLSVELHRGAKKAPIKSEARTQSQWVACRWSDPPLSTAITLYRDSKKGFLQKPLSLRLIDDSEGAGGKAVADFSFDAAGFAFSEDFKKTSTVKLRAVVSRCAR